MDDRPDTTFFFQIETLPDIDHPCPKPLKLWHWLIKRLSFGERDMIYDPFLGSGTTMVAAEQLGRLCYGVEIEPKYVAVALERLAGMGLEPRKEEP